MKYGNPYNIMTMYRKEIKAWPQVKNGDADSFQKFCNFLVKCENITQASQWNPLDTPDVICMLLSKLPEKLRGCLHETRNEISFPSEKNSVYFTCHCVRNEMKFHFGVVLSETAHQKI